MRKMIDTIYEIMQISHKQDDELFLTFLTDDIEYHYHVGSRPLLGKQWVRKFLKKYREFTTDAQWRIDNFAEKEDKLFVEGYEEYLDTRTNERIAHPYMGIFEFRDGKICKWRDYFEMDNKKKE